MRVVATTEMGLLGPHGQRPAPLQEPVREVTPAPELGDGEFVRCLPPYPTRAVR